MSVNLKIIVAAVVALVVGLVIGFFAGRVLLEHKWSQPYAVLTPSEATKAAEGADPSPPAGTKVLKPMPIGRARVALAELTASDPMRSPGASVGAGEDGVELHVVVENKSACKITGASGVAYGFDPRGRPAATNKHGEPFVAFKLEAPLEPGKKAIVSEKLRFAESATLAVAHIDATTCADGTAWKRQ